jgi:hypothetical protein
MTSSFVEEWSTLLSRPSLGKREVDAGHSIRLVYGADEVGRPIFFSISSVKPGLPDFSRAVRIERGVRAIDGRWTLSMTLTDMRFTEVYLRLCEDLVRRTENAASEISAMNQLLIGLSEWKDLFHDSLDQRPTLGKIRGLVAELWFGFDYLLASAPIREILPAWTGPFGSPQDYNFSSGSSFEVKSIHTDSRDVHISSAEQLDPGERQLMLAAVTLTQVLPSTPESVSVLSLVRAILENLSHADVPPRMLHDRLEALGVDLSDTSYSEHWFRIVKCQLFDVNARFPAVRRSELPIGIGSVEYTLSLSALAPFTTKLSTLTS